MSHYGERSQYSNQTVSTGGAAVTKYVPRITQNSIQSINQSLFKAGNTSVANRNGFYYESVFLSTQRQRGDVSWGNMLSTIPLNTVVTDSTPCLKKPNP